MILLFFFCFIIQIQKNYIFSKNKILELPAELINIVYLLQFKHI